MFGVMGCFIRIDFDDYDSCEGLLNGTVGTAPSCNKACPH